MFQQIADELLDNASPALHNQAMMEFGAMLCKPKNPACGICPVRTGCVAFKTNATTYLPVKIKTVKIRKRYFNYMLISDGEKILMNKRNEGDIWANMYDLPLIETPELMEPNDLLQLPQMKIFGDNIALKDNSAVIKHVLTHQHLYIRFLILKDFPEKLQENWFYTEVDNLKNLALPQRIFIFIKYFFNF
jgi:A/G-specific adenine glycosylase